MITYDIPTPSGEKKGGNKFTFVRKQDRYYTWGITVCLWYSDYYCVALQCMKVELRVRSDAFEGGLPWEHDGLGPGQ